MQKDVCCQVKMLSLKNHLRNSKRRRGVDCPGKEKNKLLSVYQNRRYDSDYKVIKKVVDENLLGELLRLNFITTVTMTN